MAGKGTAHFLRFERQTLSIRAKCRLLSSGDFRRRLRFDRLDTFRPSRFGDDRRRGRRGRGNDLLIFESLRGELEATVERGQILDVRIDPFQFTKSVGRLQVVQEAVVAEEEVARGHTPVDRRHRLALAATRIAWIDAREGTACERDEASRKRSLTSIAHSDET